MILVLPSKGTIYNILDSVDKRNRWNDILVLKITKKPRKSRSFFIRNSLKFVIRGI